VYIEAPRFVRLNRRAGRLPSCSTFGAHSRSSFAPTSSSRARLADDLPTPAFDARKRQARMSARPASPSKCSPIRAQDGPHLSSAPWDNSPGSVPSLPPLYGLGEIPRSRMRKRRVSRSDRQGVRRLCLRRRVALWLPAHTGDRVECRNRPCQRRGEGRSVPLREPGFCFARSRHRALIDARASALLGSDVRRGCGGTSAESAGAGSGSKSAGGAIGNLELERAANPVAA